MPPRAILHLIDTGGPGGAETVFLETVTGLDPQRWRSVSVVPERDWLDAALRERGEAPLLVPTEGAFDVRYLYRLLRLVREHRISLIHAHLLTASVYGSMVARMAGIPVVCTFHGPADIEREGRRLTPKLRILDRRKNRVVFVSEALRHRFTRQHPLQLAGSAVVANGIDGGAFRPGRDPSFRDELGVGCDDILVGAVGNVRPSKDYFTFLGAAAALVRRSPRYRFVVAGDVRSPLLPDLLALRSDLGLDDKVVFSGFQTDAARIFRALDVYALSSRAEGFSLTTVQAMACGIPVVATRCGGPEEILRDGVTGHLVPTGNPGALADGIHEVAQNPERSRALAAAARGDAVRRFSVRAMISGYEGVYREALGDRACAEAPVLVG
jgi:glycosyltransferase involved in cell wall biosynthesis